MATPSALEIEQAISDLVAEPFDPREFPYRFLDIFGCNPTTLRRLRKGDANKSGVGGVLWRKKIHIKVAPPGEVHEAFLALRADEETRRKVEKARFILATDGDSIEAEDLGLGQPLACAYTELPNHFGFLLPLAGIEVTQEIRDNPVDIRATRHLNQLYVELLRHNPDWGAPERRADMNHFMARLIFCFFAEDTGIFNGDDLFTATVQQMSRPDGSDTHEVIAELFRAMNIPIAERKAANIPRWADVFPYVNGHLFSGALDVPRFTQRARSYLLQAGALNWRAINPDIFGSMIQAVVGEEERSQAGLHYTSVPNILKVLNPLFLDDLRRQLDEAGDNPRKLLNLRKRLSRIRVFDPACGSGNFLVIAYKQMRAIEAEIDRRRGEKGRKTGIPIDNFRGIEINSFAAEIARLALIIAEYQCNVEYCGQELALNEFLPLSRDNWIVCGNALRLNWADICPREGTAVLHTADDLFNTPLEQPEIDFENEGGELYICGNPPYVGNKGQSPEQKADLEHVFASRTRRWRSLDYVAGWFMKTAEYGQQTDAPAAFVATNSICQGEQVPVLWPLIFETGHEITFAHTSFKWHNLAANKAGVTVVIVGISRHPPKERLLFTDTGEGEPLVQRVRNINPYLVPGPNIIVKKHSKPLAELPEMIFGNIPYDGGHLLLNRAELLALGLTKQQRRKFIRRLYGASEFIRGNVRYCIWINDNDLEEAMNIPSIAERIRLVHDFRVKSKRGATKELATTPHKFGNISFHGNNYSIVVPRVSSENRPFLPAGIVVNGIIGDSFALYDTPLWTLALLLSRLHLVWVHTVCGKLETRFRYSNTLGWHTFPVPKLTEKNKADLTAAAEAILLAREAHYPATLADLYKPDAMPEDLRHAHERNDEIVERIYIGRRFRSDTERLQKLFDMYVKLTGSEG